MRIIFLLFLTSLSAFSQNSPQIKVIPNPRSIDDFDHQFKGCLENSECDQVMGLQLSRWKDLISKVKSPDMEASKKAKFMELFRAKYGIPAEFYTVQKSQQGFKPMLFDSPCKEHNPKNGTKILKGTAFIKSLTKDKATVWRDQSQIEVPVGELLQPQPVVLYEGSTPTVYQLPIGEQPLFIKDKSMFVLKEEDDFFYALKISSNGDWKVEDLDLTRLSDYEEKRTEVACPKEATKLAPVMFGVEFCKTIWNEDLKKSVVVKMHQGCVI